MRARALAAILLAAALSAAGCGSGSEQHAAPRPTLPPLVASALAARSDEVAAALEAGDDCRARTLAQQLQQETITAIEARRVPSAFQEELMSTATDLAARIACVPPAQPEDRGKGKDRGKHDRKHEGND